MPLKTYPIRYLILLGLLTGCGPWVPMSYDLKAPPPNLAQTNDSQEGSITLEYLQRQNGYDIYDLEVVNCSPDPLEFSPHRISFYASSKLFSPINATDDVHALSFPNSQLWMKRVFADKPWEVNRVYQQKARSKANATIFLAILATAVVLYDDAKDASDSKKETWTKKNQRAAAGRDLLANVAITAAQVAQADAVQASEDTYYIPYELFPDCYIKPGESMRGKVFIRVENSYQYARLVVPLENTDFVFDLKRRGATGKSK